MTDSRLALGLVFGKTPNENVSEIMSDIPACKSPVRMQRHLERLPPVPFDKQLLNAGDWVKDALLYDEKLLCIGHEIPAKLQDGPQ